MRWLGAFLLACFASAALGTSAVASPEWCQNDPVLVVEGRQVHIVTAIAWSDVGKVTGPLSYEISLPANVHASVATPNGPALQSSVTIVRTTEEWSGGGIPVTVRLTVSATEAFPTTVTVSGPGLDTTLTTQKSSSEPATIQFTLTR